LIKHIKALKHTNKGPKTTPRSQPIIGITNKNEIINNKISRFKNDLHI
jgi:hypothetical protein